MNEVYELGPFAKRFDSFEKEEQRWIEKMKRQLETDLSVGKPLRFPWFREKKFLNKRLYYFVNFKSGKALLIAFEDKKNQRKIIQDLLMQQEHYLKLIQ